jgi:hypothetical protein
MGQVEHPALRGRHQADGPRGIGQLCIVADPEPDLRPVQDDGFFRDEREGDFESAGGQAVDSVCGISREIDELARLVDPPSS